VHLKPELVGAEPVKQPPVQKRKVLRRRTRRNQNRLRQALRMAASSLHREKSYLGVKYRRLRTRLGAPKAITAMAHQLARIIWTLITRQIPFDLTECLC
jgi:hypothetical protein